MGQRLVDKDREEIEYELLEVPKGFKISKRYIIISDRIIKIDFRLLKGPKKPYFSHPPLIYTDPEVMKKMCDKYFASCEGVLHDRWGNILLNENDTPVYGVVKPYTISGLARFLGMSTEALKMYRRGQRDDVGFGNSNLQFSDVLLDARQKVEEYAEHRLYDKDGSYGARFVLDHGFGWHTTKEDAEIKNMWKSSKLKEKEFELKAKLLASGEEDTDVTINIVRGKK